MSVMLMTDPLPDKLPRTRNEWKVAPTSQIELTSRSGHRKPWVARIKDQRGRVVTRRFDDDREACNWLLLRKYTIDRRRMEARVTPFHCRRSDFCALSIGHRGVCRDAADAEVPAPLASDPPMAEAVLSDIDLRTAAGPAAGERAATGTVVDLDAETAERSGRTDRT